MNKAILVNENVTITSLGFNEKLDTFPKRMEYRGNTYNFIEAGLKCLVKKGERIAQVITMSDERANYRLRYDQQDASWTLMAISTRS